MPSQDKSVFTAALRRAGPGYGVHPPLVRHDLGMYQPGLGATDPATMADPVSTVLGFVAGIPKLVLYTAGAWVVWKYVLKK